MPQDTNPVPPEQRTITIHEDGTVEGLEQCRKYILDDPQRRATMRRFLFAKVPTDNTAKSNQQTSIS